MAENVNLIKASDILICVSVCTKLFSLLHRACCRVTQLLYQLMHLYKIYTLKH